MVVVLRLVFFSILVVCVLQISLSLSSSLTRELVCLPRHLYRRPSSYAEATFPAASPQFAPYSLNDETQEGLLQVDSGYLHYRVVHPIKRIVELDGEDRPVHTQFGEPLLVYLNGNAGNLYTTWTEVGQDLANITDMPVLLHDYRGYGISSSHKKVDYLTMVEDVEFLIQRYVHHYRPRRLFFYGRSLGGGIACHLAKNFKEAGLILETPFLSTNCLTWRYRWVFGNIERLPTLTHFKNSVVVGLAETDGIVDTRCTRSTLERLCTGGSCEFVMVKGDHNSVHQNRSWRKSVKKFCAKNGPTKENSDLE